MAFKDKEIIMIVTDEPEHVSHVKINQILAYFYVELCKRKIHQNFHCEGCEENWPSQRDHLCCLLSEYEIFSQHYEDIKHEVNLDAFHSLCALLTEMASIPMHQELSERINQLSEKSSDVVCSTFLDMEQAVDDDEKIVDLVRDWCGSIDEFTPMNVELFSWLKDFLNH